MRTERNDRVEVLLARQSAKSITDKSITDKFPNDKAHGDTQHSHAAVNGEARVNGACAGSPGKLPTNARALAEVVIIDNRSLVRECFARSLRSVTDAQVISFPTVEAWLEVAERYNPSAVLLCITGKPRDPIVQRQLALVAQGSTRVPTIIMGEAEEPDQIIETLERGARGYIPTSLSLAIAVQALRLVAEGGVFVPASSLIAARKQLSRGAPAGKGEPDVFTARQAAVVEALCKGKANKVIAYELNMCESTVKVHVRNIMKKLRAKNRTEVAVMVKGLNREELARHLAQSQ